MRNEANHSPDKWKIPYEEVRGLFIEALNRIFTTGSPATDNILEHADTRVLEEFASKYDENDYCDSDDHLCEDCTADATDRAMDMEDNR